MSTITLQNCFTFESSIKVVGSKQKRVAAQVRRHNYCHYITSNMITCGRVTHDCVSGARCNGSGASQWMKFDTGYNYTTMFLKLV